MLTLTNLTGQFLTTPSAVAYTASAIAEEDGIYEKEFLFFNQLRPKNLRNNTEDRVQGYSLPLHSPLGENRAGLRQ